MKSLDKLASRISKILIDCFDRGNKVLICGNGGSAAQATHFVGELLGHFEKDRQPLPAISLFDLSSITAIANDDGYDYVFSRQVFALGNKGDVLIVLTTSGNSVNINLAADIAWDKGMRVVNFPLKDELKMSTAETQEVHLKLIHSICRKIDENYSL